MVKITEGIEVLARGMCEAHKKQAEIAKRRGKKEHQQAAENDMERERKWKRECLEVEIRGILSIEGFTRMVGDPLFLYFLIPLITYTIKVVKM